MPSTEGDHHAFGVPTDFPCMEKMGFSTKRTVVGFWVITVNPGLVSLERKFGHL
jgi:hypothetical protein